MRRAAALAILLLPSLASADDAADIRKVLDAQVAAWNKGDLEGYMAGYWKSPGLTFYGGGSVTKGWDETLARYKKRYQGDGKEMGQLDFAELTIESMGKEAAIARGKWHLAMKNGKDLKGLFTVILRKVPAGWRIVHDHSSSE